jgi:hypothetical protein
VTKSRPASMQRLTEDGSKLCVQHQTSAESVACERAGKTDSTSSAAVVDASFDDSSLRWLEINT